MAQGQFTKEEAEDVYLFLEAAKTAAETAQPFKEVFDAIPKRKQNDFIGHANLNEEKKVE